MNAKEEVYKILKYQKRMSQTGGAKREEYKDKVKEHKRNLVGAGYAKDDIKRMIQRGGVELTELMKKAEEIEGLANAKCEQINTTTKQLEEEKTKYNELDTRYKQELATAKETHERELAATKETHERELATAKEGTTASSAQIEQSTKAITDIDAALTKIFDKLKECNPPATPGPINPAEI